MEEDKITLVTYSYQVSRIRVNELQKELFGLTTLSLSELNMTQEERKSAIVRVSSDFGLELFPFWLSLNQVISPVGRTLATDTTAANPNTIVFITKNSRFRILSTNTNTHQRNTEVIIHNCCGTNFEGKRLVAMI